MIDRQTAQESSQTPKLYVSTEALGSQVPYYAVLVSTYDLGRQPFGLASPAAWLNRPGVSVKCVDLSRAPFREIDFERADFVGMYLPMHTATRLAGAVIPKIRRTNSCARLCTFGLYAPSNSEYLRGLGVRFILGGEFEQPLVDLIQKLRDGGAFVFPSACVVSIQRQRFLVPDRRSLPNLCRYSQLERADGSRRVVGYTEASRGCKHLCQHCPVVPVYKGKFRVVQKEVVLDDVRQQVAAGAQHITFGDPDFFNAVGHPIPLVRTLQSEFPDLTYDVTIKIEHLLKHSEHIRTLKDTGCAFVTSAIESIDDRILQILAKKHTRADFLRVLELMRTAELPLAPTFVSFTPWTSLEGYVDLLHLIADLQLVSSVAAVQLAVRLLLPKGSLLLERQDIKRWVVGFDDQSLCYQWRHPDTKMDELHVRVDRVVRDAAKRKASREDTFQAILHILAEIGGPQQMARKSSLTARSPCTIPYLTEPWFC